ncbi:MAG: ArsR family transcriptional regulator [Bacteroidia bacterium]
MEDELKESTNSIRIELNRFEKAGFLNSYFSGNKKLFRANTNHPLFTDIQNIVKKMVGIEYVLDYTLKRIGNLEMVYLVGDLASGIDNKKIQLVLIGDINNNYLVELVAKAEKKVNKKIILEVVKNHNEFNENYTQNNNAEPLLVWRK